MINNRAVTEPIFIVGAPRSGTTLLYQTLCNHRDLSYFTRNVIRAGVYRKGRILGYRKESLGRITNLIYRDELSIQPHEAPECWSVYLGTYDYLTENECTEEIVEHYSRVISQVQNIFRRPRFINKNPQHCTRVRILNRIFPDAKFIHIVRDANAVACSTLYSSSTFQPTNTYFSSLREKIFPLIGEMYSRGNLSEIQLYKLARNILVSKAREAKAFGITRYYEINYEELAARPREKIEEVLSFCNLENYSDFEDGLPDIRNENIKWETMLNGKLPS
jgi:omega-hydroxy-beta-dihydromenaquinone-9 sulfotransferase